MAEFVMCSSDAVGGFKSEPIPLLTSNAVVSAGDPASGAAGNPPSWSEWVASGDGSKGYRWERGQVRGAITVRMENVPVCKVAAGEFRNGRRSLVRASSINH